MEVVVTVWAVGRAILQSNRHQQQTNTQLFTGRMPFLSPNHQCQKVFKYQRQYLGIYIYYLSTDINCSSWKKVFKYCSWGSLFVTTLHTESNVLEVHGRRCHSWLTWHKDDDNRRTPRSKLSKSNDLVIYNNNYAYTAYFFTELNQ